MSSAALFLPLKYLHMLLAAVSVSLFTLRFTLREYRQKPLQGARYRILPHLIDSALLASGICLALIAHYSPLETAWFALKLCLVLLYIVLGIRAMRGASAGARRPAAALALVTAATVALLAVYKPG